MSGICSAHQGHDPTCSMCCAIPLTDEDVAYYKGWDAHCEIFSREALAERDWMLVETCVMEAYEYLEKTARSQALKTPSEGIWIRDAIKGLDELRRLNRDFGQVSSTTKPNKTDG